MCCNISIVFLDLARKTKPNLRARVYSDGSPSKRRWTNCHHDAIITPGNQRQCLEVRFVFHFIRPSLSPVSFAPRTRDRSEARPRPCMLPVRWTLAGYAVYARLFNHCSFRGPPIQFLVLSSHRFARHQRRAMYTQVVCVMSLQGVHHEK